MLKVVLGRCLQVLIRMQTSRLMHYMILIHVVGFSIANKFLQIGWQKRMLTNFRLILITKLKIW